MSTSGAREVQAGSVRNTSQRMSRSGESSQALLPQRPPRNFDRDTSSQAESSTRTRRITAQIEPIKERPAAPESGSRRISSTAVSRRPPAAKGEPSTATLREWGYVVDEELFGDLPIAYSNAHGFYRCNLCQCGVRDVKTHFTSRGGPHGSAYRADLPRFPRILARYKEYDPYEYLPEGITSANPYPHHIPGIDTSSGYGCDLCTFYATTRGWVSRHIHSVHDIPVGDVSGIGERILPYHDCQTLQRFWRFPRSSWFPSTPSTSSVTARPSARRSNGLPAKAHPLPLAKHPHLPTSTSQQNRSPSRSSSLSSVASSSSLSSVGPCPGLPAMPLPGYIIGDALFGDLPIAYHPRYHFYRCGICHMGAINVVHHFSTAGPHAGLHKTVDRKEMLAKYPPEDPRTRLRPTPSLAKPHPHIPGIAFSAKGYGCRSCDYIADEITTVKQHGETKHCLDADTAAKYVDIPNIQRFFPRSPWFPSSAPGGGAFPNQQAARYDPTRLLTGRSLPQKRPRQSQPAPPPTSPDRAIRTSSASGQSGPIRHSAPAPAKRARLADPILSVDVQQALETITQLKSSVEHLEKKQAETEEKQSTTEASLRAALERVKEMEALVESGGAGRAAQQQLRAAAAEAAKEKVRKAKEAWEKAQAEAEVASALLLAEEMEADVVDGDAKAGGSISGRGGSLQGGYEGYDSDEVEETLEEAEVIEEDYIPLADIDMGDEISPPCLQTQRRSPSADDDSRANSRASSYAAFQEALRGEQGAD